MSYVVIARKYRPQAFDEVIGQEPISSILKNAIAAGRIAHAVLFSGPRGVGKTSMARIFAKALNCQKGPTPDPCGKCSACREVEEGRALDVMEIDGASNRGIEDVRAIRESVKFAPASGRFKIYIIDEVHQITTDAFNALLKTLEEPPLHVKFVFATTAPQKIPATVLSRCQRFDFRRIPTRRIVETLAGIARHEKIKIKEDALHEIAKASDGSLRDAESILDQLASFSGGEIGAGEVSETLGSVNPEEFFALFDAIGSRDGEKVLGFVDRTIAQGKEPAFFLEKCQEHVRNLMVMKVSASLAALVEASDTYRARLTEQAGHFMKEDLFYIFAVLSQAVQNLRRFNAKRAPLEMALLKCALREPFGGAPAKAVQEKPAARPVSPALGAEPRRPEAPAAEIPLAAAPAPEPSTLGDLWDTFVRRVRAEKISAATFLQSGSPVAIRGNAVIVGFPPELAFNVEALKSEANLAVLEKHLSELLQIKARVEFRLGTPESEATAASSAAPETAEDDAIVKTALGIFGGRVIKS